MSSNPPQELRSRLGVFLLGIVAGFILLLVAVFGPFVASNFFTDDGTGSPGNPERNQPVQRNM